MPRLGDSVHDVDERMENAVLLRRESALGPSIPERMPFESVEVSEALGGDAVDLAEDLLRPAVVDRGEGRAVFGHRPRVAFRAGEIDELGVVVGQESVIVQAATQRAVDEDESVVHGVVP